MIKIGTDFLFWLSGAVMLQSKDQVFPTYTAVDLRVLTYTEDFFFQALTKMKNADTFSMRTLCRMTKSKIRHQSTDRATGHTHQISETARENTSNQANLTNYQEWRKRTIKQLKCIFQNYHNFAFHWGTTRAENIDTLSWFNIVFAHRNHGNEPHTVTVLL